MATLYAFNLRPNDTWTYQYYGVDDRKDCGLKFAAVVRYDSGEWNCNYKGDNLKFYLYVTCK